MISAVVHYGSARYPTEKKFNLMMSQKLTVIVFIFQLIT